MRQPSFRFRQFEVFHDQCAMKVGTDGVLLGAWASVEGAKRILDIGTGSGLIALMTAQRNAEAQVVGVELDAAAAAQARDNALVSPWADRIHIWQQDIRELSAEQAGRFDCILCNPPFFTEDTTSPDALRATARHCSGLTFAQLIASVDRLLSDHGVLSVILPINSSKEFITSALKHSLFIRNKCLIRTVPYKDFRRVMLTFSRERDAYQEEILTLQNQDGSRSDAYSELTRDFYL